MLTVAKPSQPLLLFHSCKRWSRAAHPDHQHAVQTATFIIPQAQYIKQLKTAQLLTIHAAYLYTQCTNSRVCVSIWAIHVPCHQITWSSASFTDLGKNDPEAGRTNSSSSASSTLHEQLQDTSDCRQPAVGKVRSHLAWHRATASLDDFIRRITNTFNRRPWRHWHSQQIIYLYFHIYTTSPQIPLVILWMRI